uniref:CSON002658 protein n=1 Tax=Culicoides sonorensis TaxID=179676 RepID=A0A336MN89_CULSO
MKMRTNYDSATKVWSAPQRPYTFGDRSVGEVVYDALRTRPDRIIEICHETGKKVTAAEMYKNSVNVARSYLQMGLTENDVVLIILNNHHFVAPIVVGATFIGAAFCALEVGLNRKDLRNLMYQLQPKVIVCEKTEFIKVRSLVTELDMRVDVFVNNPLHPNSHEDLFIDLGDHDNFKPTILRNVEDRTAAVLSSSATMGTYKLIAISHPQLLHNYTENFGIVETLFTYSTLSWITGIVALFGCIVLNVRRIITPKSFNPVDFLEIIQKYSVNLILLQPDRLNATLNCPKIEETNFDSVYVVMVTGKPLPEHMKIKMEKYLTAGAIVTTYGMTETAGTITSSMYSSDKKGSAGLLVDNTCAKICDEFGYTLNPGQVGEIHVKGEFKFLGYYNNPKLTESSIDDEGYLKTGDIGYIDEDGELFIVDRKKDTIVMGKHFVYPSILEGIIHQHPGVYDVCIIEAPHPELSMVPVAAVIPRTGANVTADEIVEFVAKRQPPELQLKGGVVFVDDLAKTATGKFKRYLVKETVAQKLAESNKHMR